MMKKRKVLKRRYKGAKVLHARRYAPRVRNDKRPQLVDKFYAMVLRDQLGEWL